MIPILFNKDEKTFTSLGLGQMDAALVEVERERNGNYTLYAEVPFSSPQAKQLTKEMLIKADAGSRTKWQTFKINRTIKDTNADVIKVYADHISMDTINDAMKPKVVIRQQTAEGALRQWANSLVSGKAYDVQSDITYVGSTEWTIDEVENARQALGGVEGSILDVWGGEFEFDNNRIILHKEMGREAPTVLEYGRNIVSLEYEELIDGVYTSIYPYAIYTPRSEDNRQQEPVMVTLDELIVDSEYAGNYETRRIQIVDFSNEFDSNAENPEIPTQAKLRTLAKAYVKNNGYGIPKISQEIDFVDLSKTLDYQDIQVMEEIELNDRVPVYYPNIDAETNDVKVTTTNWDVLNNRYSKITLSTIGAMNSNSITSKLNTAIKDLKAEQKKINNTVPYLINGQGNRVWWTTPDDNMEHKIDDTWFKKNGKYTIICRWNGSMWEEVLNEETFVAELEAEIQDAISKAEEAKSLAVSEAESALAQAKADATAKANAIKEQISGEVNTAIETAESAKALATSEAERVLAQAKDDATTKANAVKEEVSNSVNTAIDTANTAKQTAIDNYNNAVAEAARLDGEQKTEFDERFTTIQNSVDSFNDAVSDADTKAEAIKQGLGLSEINLTNQQITDQIKQDYDSLKSTANNAIQEISTLSSEYQTFLTDKFNPTLTTATNALSLAEKNEGLFYSANLIDEVTGQSNVYTKAEIDGTNGYVNKATYTKDAQSISSELERVEGVALASGANINLLITRNQKVNTWLDANPSGRTYPTPNDTTNATATSPDLISVTPGEKITLSKTTVLTDNFFRIDYLNANKQYVNRYTQNANVATITIPANVAYLWVSYPLDSYPKIERGEVKTQWTLAPQDQVNQSTVNYLTSKIEQTPEMITEALTSYTKTDNLDDTVASYLTNDTTKTARVITTKLSDYQTTSDLDENIVKLLDNTTTQTAGRFNNKLQALEGKIPTEIGGRNLLRGTADFDTTLWRNVSTAIPSTRDSRYKQVRVDGDYTVAPITTMSVQGWNFEIGQDYVVSVYAKSEVLGNKLGLTAQSTPYFEPQVVAVSEWRRYVWKFKATISSLTNFRFETRNGERVWITQPQIEKGTVPTDWTRALEDLATASQTNEIERTANYTKSAITNVTKDGLVAGSTVNQTKDGITERVARLDTNGNVTYSNRDVKLDSIVSTVANDSYISNIIQASDLVQSTIRENTKVDLLAKAASGTSMTKDPNFNKGINGLIVYDNNNTNTISIYRNLTNDPSLPSGKGYRLDIYHASSTATSPYRGGVALPTQSWANGVVVVRFTARLDVGKSFVYAQNSIGTGSTHGWLTSNKGTGRWEQYAYYYRFGASGTFQTFGFISVNATSAAFTWYLADFDIINLGLSSQSQITQLVDNINLKVSKGETISQLNLEAGNVLIQSGTNKLNVTQDTTFIQDATIKSAMIDTIDVKKITGVTADFTTMVTKGLTANVISANMINANDAMFEKLFANSMATTKLATQEAWIVDANIKEINAGTIKSGEIEAARIKSTDVVTNGLTTDVIKSTHIEASVNLVNKIFAEEALINALTSKTIFANKIKGIEIDASKITSGELDAARIKSIDVVTAGLSANVVEAKHIKAEAGLVGKLFSTTAYIEELTNKTVFTEKIQAINISADKITTGTLDASKVSVVNIDANNITANKTAFVQTAWNDINSEVTIDGSGIKTQSTNGDFSRIVSGELRSFNKDSSSTAILGSGRSQYFDKDGSQFILGNTLHGTEWNNAGTLQVTHNRRFAIGRYADYAVNNGQFHPYIALEYPAGRTGDEPLGIVRFYKAVYLQKDIYAGNNAVSGLSKITFNNGGQIESQPNTSNMLIGASNKLIVYASGTNSLEIDSGYMYLRRNLSMEGNNITNQSDRRLKTNIVDTPVDSLSAISNWDFKAFDRVNNGSHDDIGLIAQDTSEIVVYDEENDIFNVNSSKQIMMNSHGIQQLNTKVDDEISKLKAQIASLQDELALLKGA